MCAPLNASSRLSFDARAIGAMRRGAVFCNVSRGMTVDQDALVDALRTGQLSAAAVDVVHEEPLPPDSPLWDVANLHISPHCSGATDDSHTAGALALFADNLRRWRDREPLVNLVELDGADD